MKIILTYEFDETEQGRATEILEGEKWKFLVRDFDNEVLRPITKYGAPDGDGKKEEVYEEIRDKLWELIQDAELSL